MEEKNKKVVVIGAGIIGSCCALKLLRDGHRVTLIDREDPGHGCSFGNAGAISSSAVIPMSLPGMWKNIPKWLFDSKGPLSVKTAYIPRLIPWLTQWLVCSSKEIAKKSAFALSSLNSNASEDYKEFLSLSQYSDLIKNTGNLYVYRQRPSGKGDKFAAELRRVLGVRVEELSRGEVQEIEPCIGPGYNYGMFFPDNSFTVNPLRLVNTLVSNFLKEGGMLIKDEVKSYKKNGTVFKVSTRSLEIEATAVVVACGAWSKKLMPKTEASVPIETERGYHIMLHNPSLVPKLPVMAGDFKFFATPMENGLRLAGTVELSGLYSLPNWKRAEVLVEHVKKVIPNIEASGTSVWVGNRPSIPDSVPLIGESKVYNNLYYAYGHGHYGMSGGPGTAKILSHLITGSNINFEVGQFSIERFN